jgi:hypothetical protein
LASVRSRLSLKILLPLLLIATFSVASFAATVGITTETYQSQNGVYYVVYGGFTATGNGFFVVTNGGSATPSPTWTNGGAAQTALTAGDWFFSVTLAPAAGLFGSSHIITVSWSSGTSYTSLDTITFTNSSTITGSMTFLFDMKASSFTAPTGIVITVT